MSRAAELVASFRATFRVAGLTYSDADLNGAAQWLLDFGAGANDLPGVCKALEASADPDHKGTVSKGRECLAGYLRAAVEVRRDWRALFLKSQAARLDYFIECAEQAPNAEAAILRQYRPIRNDPTLANARIKRAKLLLEADRLDGARSAKAA